MLFCYRYLLHYHPILAFCVFVPSFASLVLLTALATWGLAALYVNSRDHHETRTSVFGASVADRPSKSERHPSAVRFEQQPGMTEVAEESTESTGLYTEEEGSEVEEDSQGGTGFGEEETTGQVKHEADDDAATIGGVSAERDLFGHHANVLTIFTRLIAVHALTFCRSQSETTRATRSTFGPMSASASVSTSQRTQRTSE